MEKQYAFDLEAQQRFNFVVDTGKQAFAGTALVNPERRIESSDLHSIDEFHYAVSPANPDNPWRLAKEERPVAKDSSFFGNWEAPGGPLEHIRLATDAAGLITNILQAHLRSSGEMTSENLKIMDEVSHLNPYHAAAAAGLHDEGREITHTFYTNDTFGRLLLKKIGIRDDLITMMPDERVMWTPIDDENSLNTGLSNIDRTILSLPAEAVIVRIADEFGKRFPGSDRLYQPEDYDTWDREKWAAGYMNRASTGRPSDSKMREMMALHVANVPGYFRALDKWVQEVSTLTLKDVTQSLNEQLSGSLEPLK